MQHRLELLLRRLYGPRGERFNPNQLLLFPDLPADALAASPPPTCEEKPKRKWRPHGRGRLPEHLPRVPRHHELTTPSGSVRAVAISAKRSASTPASSWITNRRRCSSSSTLSTSTPVYAVARRQQALPPGPPVAVVPQPTPAGESSSPAMPPAAAEGQEVMSTPSESSLPERQPTEQEAPKPSTSPGVASPAPVIIAAAKPAMPIAKGLPGPGLRASDRQQVRRSPAAVPIGEHLRAARSLFATFDVVRLAAGLWPAAATAV